MRISIVIFFIVLPSVILAQTGNYFLSHYSPGKEHFDNICFDITQDARGVMYFATKGGILEFDGRNWDVLKGQSAVYTLQVNASGEIFWGGAKGFGKVGIDKHGFQQLELLTDSTIFDVFQSLSVKNYIYFLSENAIYIYDTAARKTTSIKSTDISGPFTRMFELFGAVYVNTSQQGIFKVEKNSLTHSKLGISTEVIFFSRIDNAYVLGTSDNKIFVCNEDLQPREIQLEDQAYANASVIISGSWMNRQLLALGTLRGGVIFINPLTGKTQEIINYSTGLPDNEVFALRQDRNQNIWIAHDYGFTRVSPYNMPFRSFSHYPGLHGNVLCAYSYKGSVYAGTSLGLFKLQKEDVYDELIYYVDVEIKEPKKVAAVVQENKKPEEIKTEPKPQTESKKKGIFNFLKKNRNKNKEQQSVTAKDTPTAEEKPTEKIPEVSLPTPPRFKRVKHTEKVLRASQYVYKKVNGIDAKINNIIEINGKLVASGLGGIFEVQSLESKVILDQPVRCIYASKYKNILFASTYNDEVRTIFSDSKGWKQSNPLNDIDDQINYIFEGKEKELWLCGLNKIYRLEITEAQIELKQAIALPNREMETTLGVSWNDEVLFANGEGFFKYDRSASNILKVDSLPSPSQYFVHDLNILYHNQHGWNSAGKTGGQTNLQLLNLFNDLRFLSSDKEADNLWLISGGNELYKFFGDKITIDEVAFPLFLKTITNENIKTATSSHIKISEDKSAVNFEIVQPDFLTPEAIEFRYQLKGMNDQWSDWSNNNNNISFPYLPPGEYTLLVQSKNIFGKKSELKPMTFEVLPPYWKRSWFYAMEFAFLASLVLLSFKLNARYRIVSRVLSLLTIILLIQFVQTVINATIRFNEDSPVIDFIIQVFIALLILPVEGYLRNLMFKSLDASSKFYQFISPQSALDKLKDRHEKFEPSDEEITS